MADRRASPPPSGFTFGVLMSAIAGVMVWLTITAYSAKHAAWDSPLYYIAGMPALALVSALLAYINTARPWRYAVAPYAAQALVGLFLNPGQVFPLGIILFPILLTPGLVLVYLAAASKEGLRIRIRERRKRLRITDDVMKKAKLDDIMSDLEKEVHAGRVNPEDDMPSRAQTPRAPIQTPKPPQRPR